MKASERRKEPRVNVRETVRFRPVTDPVSPEQLAETVDMCQRGICIATDFPLSLGAQVELYVKIPQEVSGGDPVDARCVARVVHIGSNGNGSKRLVGMRIERYECLNLRERWVS
jgi:hypothetical protein